MAIVNPPSWMQQGSYSANSDRLVISSMITQPGVVSSTGYLVTQSTTPAMSVSVAAGAAFVSGTQITDQGIYHVFNNGAVTKTITTSNGSNPRIDLVVLRIYDAQASGTQNIADIEIIAGTPAASPSAPAVPASAIELARITVGAGVTSIVNANISHASRAVAAFNTNMLQTGLVISSSQPTNVAGWRWYDPSTNITYLSNGTTWSVTGKPAYTNVTLASGWSYSAGHQIKVGLSDGLVRLRGGRIVRTSTTLVADSSTDQLWNVAIAAQYRPLVAQEAVGTGYYGTGVMNPIKVVVEADGFMKFRTNQTVSITTAPAMVIVIPPMTWITD